MAINYKKLYIELRKVAPLLSDDKYKNFDLIQDYEITNSMEFESIIRLDIIEKLIEEIENEVFTQDEKNKIHKLYKRDENEIQSFYNKKDYALHLKINNPYFGNSYEEDLKVFGNLYNKPLEEFYKNKYDCIKNYYNDNKSTIDEILGVFGLEFDSLIHKIYNIYTYSNSFYERNFYYQFYSNLFTKKSFIKIEKTNVKIDDNHQASFYYSRPIVKKNTYSSITLEIDLNLPLSELQAKINILKEYYEIKYNTDTFDIINSNQKINTSSIIGIQKNIEKFKISCYIKDCYKIIKKKYNFFTNQKIFEFLQELANENDYKFDMTLSNFEKLLKKIN